MGIKIYYDKCTACGDCVPTCPFGLLEIVDEQLQLEEGCTLCGACEEACTQGAIVIEEPAQTEAVSDGHHGVWVFTEQRRGKLKGVAFELLAKGRDLADDLDTELCAVCLGHDIDQVNQLVAYGADKVYLIDNPDLADNPEDICTYQFAELIQQHKPEIILAGATSLGRAFIPRVAAILKTGLTADCTGLEIDPETRLLRQTRPTFGGNVMATIICQARRPQMATVRPRVFSKGISDDQRAGEIITVDLAREGITAKTRLIDFIEDITGTVKLDEADIIVSGGRGLGKPENFKLLEELAQVMGASLGSSRPPVDEGWIAYSHQVGQTGKTVCPKLYVACGISGSVQHMAGMQTSETIVAINDDPQAPIFEIATYGIVGDLFKVVPLLIQKLKPE